MRPLTSEARIRPSETSVPFRASLRPPTDYTWQMEDAKRLVGPSEQLIAETGIGIFTLDRRRREGLVPWNRRFLGFAVGTRTVYPPIAVPMIRRIQELQRSDKGLIVGAGRFGLKVSPSISSNGTGIVCCG